MRDPTTPWASDKPTSREWTIFHAGYDQGRRVSRDKRRAQKRELRRLNRVRLRPSNGPPAGAAKPSFSRRSG